MKPLFLIVGASGSGKSAAVKALCKALSATEVESYTTRPPRRPGESGHLFISSEEFHSKEMVAYTLYNGYEYGVTADQLRSADFYVIDPAGVFYLKERFDDRPLLTVFLDVPADIRKERMLRRGDSEEAVSKRLMNDAEKFSYPILCRLQPDLIVDASVPLDEVVGRISDFVCRCPEERDSSEVCLKEEEEEER